MTLASPPHSYLLEDQLRGPSSVEAYIRALNKGCRCVECESGWTIVFRASAIQQ